MLWLCCGDSFFNTFEPSIFLNHNTRSAMAYQAAAFPAGEVSLLNEGILLIKMQCQEKAKDLLRQPNPIDQKNVVTLSEYYRKREALCDSVLVKLPLLRHVRLEALSNAG